MIVGTVTWGVVGAQGRIRLATIVEFISSWFIAIPFCVISLYVLNYNLLGFVASLIFGYTVGGVAMGFIILRSDWNALSQSVIARNTIEGVTWEDNDWEELPPHVQRAALCLGYSKHIWNDDQDPPSNDRDWDELTPQEKEAAKIMGFNRNKWDDGSDTSDGESKSDEKGKYDSLSWNDLPSDAKIAAKKLGYSRKLWDSDKEPASSDRQWSELNPTEQEAALILGYDRKKWDGQSENGQEKQEQKIAKSNEEGRKSPVDHAQEATAKLPETGISQLVSSSQEDQITQRTDSRSNFEDMSWNDLPSDVQAAAKTLGYDSKMWDDDKSPPSDNKSWHKLTTEEKIAAKMLGYDQRTWDDDSSSDSSSDGQDQQSESNDKKARFDEMAWKDLPSHVRAAAKTLGYDSKMWDKNGSPPTDDKWWHKLTANEQRAAQTLGYTEKSWNDDSSSSSE